MRTCIRFIGITVLLSLFIPNISFSQNQENRIALVIGNGNYSVSPLRNPVNDASDIAAVLQKLGFYVIVKTDADQRAMENSIRDFGKKLRSGGVGLFYFAGHGMQVKGRNYLIPIGADIESESDVKYEAVDAGRVLGKMEDADNDLNIVILDACRDNPFARSFRSSSRGLARMDAPKGSIIAYATAPGMVAADGEGRNGVYTKHLLRHITTPGLTVEKVLKQVRVGVINETSEKQIPWESSSLVGEFHFASKRGIVVVKRPTAETQDSTELEKERRRLERERQELEKLKMEIEREKLETERRLLEKEKKKLAHIPKAGTVSPPISIRLEGEYHVNGTNPNGSRYQGKAVIQRHENGYKITWKIGKQTFYGSGTLSANTLNINWSGGLVVYTITENGVLKGIWASGKGTEDLIPIKLAYIPKAGRVSTSQVLPDPGNLTMYRKNYGATYYFSVTGKGSGYLFGTDIYTDDSELAAASVHAGILAPGQSGIVKVTIRPGQSSYRASWKNGVRSRSWGKWDSSYSVAPAN